MKQKTKAVKLKPIGKGSRAERYGYDFDLLISWIEDIANHESSLAEEKPRYGKRAHRLSDAVDLLQELLDTQ